MNLLQLTFNKIILHNLFFSYNILYSLLFFNIFISIIMVIKNSPFNNIHIIIYVMDNYIYHILHTNIQNLINIFIMFILLQYYLFYLF